MIIGLAGKMGCGKSEVGLLIQKKLAVKCAIFNFGDILKSEVSRTYNFPLHLCYTEKGKSRVITDKTTLPLLLPKSNMTVREILQWYGTDYMRKKDPNHWVKEMEKVLRPSLNDGFAIVVADVRFINEVEYIHSLGGKCVKLLPYLGWNKYSDHDSEIALDNYHNFWTQIAPPFGKLKEASEYILNIM